MPATTPAASNLLRTHAASEYLRSVEFAGARRLPCYGSEARELADRMIAAGLLVRKGMIVVAA